MQQRTAIKQRQPTEHDMVTGGRVVVAAWCYDKVSPPAVASGDLTRCGPTNDP